jgi:sarcosine oxidase
MAFDVVVVGLGAMGSAALHHLAARRSRVLGIEQFTIGHDRGSSHGLTRIIRMGYFEHPSYVPLVRRAYELWRELEKATGETLLTITGIAEMGLPDSTLVAGTLASSRLHDLPHEVLDAAALMRRYPQFKIPKDFIGVIQPDGGFLEPEKAIRAQLALAKAAGAEIRTGEKVLGIEPAAGGVRITTANGPIEAGKVIVAAGAWASTLLPKGALPLHVTRQALLWVAPKEPAAFTPERFPVFMIESGPGIGIHYGFPMLDGAIKIALHHHEREKVLPETYDREVSPHDRALIRAGLAFIPGADGAEVAAKTCLYTMTPDEDFVLGALPGAPSIIVASPCSGHGFKFSPAIGEILADLATKDETAHDISRFSPARF